MERLGRWIFVEGALSEGAKERASVDNGASCKRPEEKRKLAAHGKWTCDGAALCRPGKGRAALKSVDKP